MQAATQAMHRQVIQQTTGHHVRTAIDTRHGLLLIHRVGQAAELQAVI